MIHLPVYRAEIADGLGDAVRASGRLAYASAARAWAPEAARAEALLAFARLRSSLPEAARASLEDADLHYLQTVLVSTGWNRNDDVFDPLEVWVARHTPAHKPFNYEHDCAHIIGHIISNVPVTCDGEVVGSAGLTLTPVPEDTAADALPAKFHVVTGALLYRVWERPELQERMDRVLAEIAKGEWFVSMECLFKGFDYALTAGDGSQRVVARGEQTAFLTKHLRAYGGSGRYGEYRVGRLLRNVVFSGKGLVRKPANPESVILPDAEPFSASAAADFPGAAAARVYVPADDDSEQSDEERNRPMAAEAEALSKQLDALRAENEGLKASLRDNDVKQHQARAEAAEAAKAKADELLKAAGEALASAQAQAQAARSEAEQAAAARAEAEKNLADAREELRSLHAAGRTAARVASAKDRLKLSDEDAAEFAAANEALADEQYARQLDLVARAIAKSAPAPAPKKETPAAGASAESDEAGEAAAAAADLARAEAERAAALSASAEDDGVNDVAKAIASYLGAAEAGGQAA